jgi:hypothetical protein
VTTDGSTPILSSGDFRSRRHYLPDEAFALSEGYEPPSDPLPEDQWHGLMDLPTDVLLRTSDHHGKQLAQMYDLWSTWVRILPSEARGGPYIFEAGWEASDDFNMSIFTTAHGYYRQGMASLRSALEVLTIAANFAVRQDRNGLDSWLSGQSEPPKPGEVRRQLASHLGKEASGVLRKLYGDLSGYIHPQRDSTSGILWGGSNGPIWEPDSFSKVYLYYRDVMAMSYVLLTLGWSEFSIPDKLWLLFESPGGAWTSSSIAKLKERFGSSPHRPDAGEARG